MHNEFRGDARNVIQAHTYVERQPAPEEPPPPWLIRSFAPKFVNRDTQKRRLSSLVATARSAGRTQVAFVSGPGGVGKSALVVQAALDERDYFTGGALHADLDRYRDRGGLKRDEVMAGFLRALGMAPSAVPADPDDRVDQFTRLTTDRRVLVVVENVATKDEVWAFAPGPGGNLLVGVGRSMPAEIVESGVETIALQGLSDDDGRALLAEFGPVAGRVLDEREKTARLVGLCGGFPHALRMVAGYLQAWPDTRITDVVARIEGSSAPLAEIDTVGGGRRLRAPFDLAHSLLGPEGATLYTALGNLDPGEFPAALAGAVLGSQRAGERALDQLIRAFLVTRVDGGPEYPSGDRFAFTSLSAFDARERAPHHPLRDPVDVRRRIVRWYCGELAGADQAVYGERLRASRLLPSMDTDDTAVPFETPRQGLEALDSAAPTVPSVLDMAVQEGMAAEAVVLAESLWPLVHERKHYALGATALDRAIACASAGGLPRGVVARLRAYRARVHIEVGEARAGGTLVRQAHEELHRAPDLRAHLAVVMETLALYREEAGSLTEAAEDLRRAGELHRETDNPRGAVLQRYQLGRVLRRHGDTTASRAELDAALNEAGSWLRENPAAPEHERAGWRLLRQRIAVELARVLSELGEDAYASSLAREAMEYMAEAGLPVKEAQALEVLAELAGRHGETERRRGFLRRARDLYAVHRVPRAVEVDRVVREEAG